MKSLKISCQNCHKLNMSKDKISQAPILHCLAAGVVYLSFLIWHIPDLNLQQFIHSYPNHVSFTACSSYSSGQQWQQVGQRRVSRRRQGVNIHAAEHTKEGLLSWGFTILGMLEPLADLAQDEIEEGQFGSRNLH